MPSSVWVAVVAMGVALAAGAVAEISDVVHGGPALLPRAVLQLAVGMALLSGLVRGRRLAWQYGRVLVRLNALFGTLALMALLGAAIDSPSWPAFGAVMLLLFGLVVPLWLVVIALGRPDARDHFGLHCPRCDSRRVGSADLLFRRCRCRGCQFTWEPSLDGATAVSF